MSIVTHIDVLLAQRKMTAGELAQRIELTAANLSILKNDKARAIRFSTLEALCRELDCQPGDLLEYIADSDGKLPPSAQTPSEHLQPPSAQPPSEHLQPPSAQTPSEHLQPPSAQPPSEHQHTE